MHYGLGFTGGVGSNSSLSSYRYRGNNTPIFQRIYHLFKEEKKSEAGKSVNSAKITVTLPEDATLTVDGVACNLTSAKRTFATPTLQPGQQYYYNLTVRLMRDGEEVVDTKKVIFEAGKHVLVDAGLTLGRLQQG